MLLTEDVLLLGNGHINIYAVGSGPIAILEGGIRMVVPVVAEQIKDATWPGQVEHLVVMHAHFDHVCGVPGLQKLFPRSRLAASEKAARVLQKPKIVGSFYREDMATTEGLLSGQFCPADTAGPVVETMTVEKIIEDGEKWNLGAGVELHFYAAPGHSPCSIMGYLPKTELLLSSDATGFPINEERLFPMFFAGYHDYMNTIRRMQELPVRMVAGGHERIISGRDESRRYLELARVEAEQTLDTVVKSWRQGLDADTITRALLDEYYRDNARKLFTESNIHMCCQLLTRRALEYAGEDLTSPHGQK